MSYSVAASFQIHVGACLVEDRVVPLKKMPTQRQRRGSTSRGEFGWQEGFDVGVCKVGRSPGGEAGGGSTEQMSSRRTVNAGVGMETG